MLIRTSLPPPPPPPARISLRYACASSRATTLYFRAKIPPLAGSDHVEIVCKASCARRPFLFSRLSPLPPPLLFCYPFRPSTLVIYRGYATDTRGGICTTGDKEEEEEEKKKKSGCPRICNTIVPLRSSGLRHSASRSDAMKRSHGSNAKEVHSAQYIDFRARRSNGFQGSRRNWNGNTWNSPRIRFGETERENCAKGVERDRNEETRGIRRKYLTKIFGKYFYE